MRLTPDELRRLRALRSLPPTCRFREPGFTNRKAGGTAREVYAGTELDILYDVIVPDCRESRMTRLVGPRDRPQSAWRPIGVL